MFKGKGGCPIPRLGYATSYATAYSSTNDLAIRNQTQDLLSVLFNPTCWANTDAGGICKITQITPRTTLLLLLLNAYLFKYLLVEHTLLTYMCFMHS